MTTNSLPILQYKDRVLQAVASNSATIISAETGAGKSTQVPQFLLDAGYEIVVTQPRRLAARSLAERVSEERGGNLGEEIGYMTAQDKMFSKNTKCLFVTDGLQAVHELLGRHSTVGRVLIIDEVHEWNMNVELLIAWSKKQTISNPDFKVVMMSATMEAGRLSEFFDNCPIINVPGRLFPIKVCNPQGSMLDDIVSLVADGRNVLVFQPGKSEIEKTIEDLKGKSLDAEILPLHGDLSSDEQRRCFTHYSRPKVVVSTNVAQTSVTIDDIDAVVDSGLERRTEMVNGVEGLYLKSISLSDAKQRKGRAGRTKEGIYIDHCKDLEGDRLEFPKAEIERMRLDQTVLRLTEIGFDMEDLSFFHQPSIDEIRRAKNDLLKLGLVDDNHQITAIGRKVTRLPVSVTFGRMVIEAERLGVMKDVITIAAILEVGQIQARKDQDGKENNRWRLHTNRETESDLIAQLNLFKAAEQMDRNQMYEAGIHIGFYHRVKETRKMLERSLSRLVNDTESEGSRENILKAICSGMVNHIYTNRFGQYIGDDEINRQLAKESVIRYPSNFVLGIPFDLEIPGRFGNRTLNLLRMVTSVSIEMLTEVAPHLLKEEKGLEPVWVSYVGMVETTTRTTFNGKIIKEVKVLEVDHPMELQLKLDWIYENYGLPYMSPIQIQDEYATVPPIRKEVIGKHPVTGEPVILYGTFVDSDSGKLGLPKWYKSLDEAEKTREILIGTLASRFNRSPSWFEGKRTRSIEEEEEDSGTMTPVMKKKLDELRKKMCR